MIGKIATTFGLKGEVKIDTYTDFIDERFTPGSFVYLKIGKEFLALKITDRRYHKGRLLIRFENMDDINKVEQYKGYELYKDKADVLPLNEGEYYFSDLVGLDVYEEGQLIGKVQNVEEGVSYNYLRLSLNNQKKALVPFVMEVFIKEVDLEHKKISINKIEGLL